MLSKRFLRWMFVRIIEAEANMSNDEKTKSVQRLWNKKFLYLIAFLLVTTALLTTVRIYCYMIKYNAKQTRLLSFYVTNNELKKNCITNNILWKLKVKMNRKKLILKIVRVNVYQSYVLMTQWELVVMF